MIGRGPRGNLRNFRAMHDQKLLATWYQLSYERIIAPDPEAVEAVEYELETRPHLEPYWERAWVDFEVVRDV